MPWRGMLRSVMRKATRPVVAAALTLAAQRGGADEVLGVQRADPAQARLQRRSLQRQVVAVQRVADLEPQRVPRAQAARRRAGGQQAVPERSGVLGLADQLDAGLAGVSGAGNDRRHAAHLGAREAERRQLRQLDQRQRGRALQREHRQLGRPVVHRHVGRQALGQPGVVGVGAAGVDDQQQVVVGEPVDDQVVHGAARVLEQQRVLGVARADPVEIVGQRGLREPDRPRAAQLELAHVRDVEDARMAAHRRCSGMMPSYCTGISQPAKGTIRAPAARWRSWRGVRRSAVSSGIRKRSLLKAAAHNDDAPR